MCEGGADFGGAELLETVGEIATGQTETVRIEPRLKPRHTTGNDTAQLQWCRKPVTYGHLNAC